MRCGQNKTDLERAQQRAFVNMIMNLRADTVGQIVADVPHGLSLQRPGALKYLSG
jgi:predicted site-specific integrase-resolvase